MKKFRFVTIASLICIALAVIISALVLYLNNNLELLTFIKWSVFIYVLIMLAFNAAMSHKFVEGKKQEILFFVSSSLLISLLIGFLLFSLWKSNFNFDRIDWFGCFTIIAGFDAMYYICNFCTIYCFLLYIY